MNDRSDPRAGNHDACLRIAEDWRGTLAQHEELLRARGMTKGIIVAEMEGGACHVLGQGCTPAEMVPLLLTAVEAALDTEERDLHEIPGPNTAGIE